MSDGANTTDTRLTVAHAGLQAAYRRDSLAIVLLPILGFVGALVWVFQVGMQPLDFALIVLGYTVASIGIDVGYHRYFAHRAFEAHPVLQGFLAVTGAMAAQGRVIRWVSNHRRHHAYSDRPEDPHSPHVSAEDPEGRGRPAAKLWHSHVAWIFTHEPSNAVHFARDMIRHPMLAWINRFYPVWLLLAMVLPAAFGALWRGTPAGAVEGLLFGWAVPVFLSQQAAFCVNSIGHFAGRRPFATPDRSTNVWWLALPSIGAGWQNNHHAFPNSARIQVERWEFDFGWWVIRFFQALGLAWNLKLPSEAQVEARRDATPLEKVA